MHARRLILSLAALATVFAGTSFADDPYVHKMPDPQGRRSMRSYSVAPSGSGTGTNYVMRRNYNYGYRVMGFNQNTHFRADHKVPGLYLSR